jgi:hypothetical protein
MRWTRSSRFCGNQIRVPITPADLSRVCGTKPSRVERKQKRSASYDSTRVVPFHKDSISLSSLPPPPSLAPPHIPSPHSLTMVTNGHAEAKKDLRSEKLTSQYSSLWNSDSAKDSDANRDARLEQYTDVVNGYYDGATILYECECRADHLRKEMLMIRVDAWGDRFHFSRFRKGESFTASVSYPRPVLHSRY